MKKYNYIKSVMLIIICAASLTTSGLYANKVSAETAQTKPAITVQSSTVSPIQIVNSPKSYLNKTVIMSAKFDKFSTLGLDYKPAFKSSEDYISFLIQRDDSKYDIPLSEMKLFLKRLEAEKFIDLKTGDIISIEGIVFSDALGDAWIDVSKLKVTQKTQEKDGVK
jgi:lysyl-tRNA synthetase class II